MFTANEKIADALDALSRDNGNSLTPEAVVERARDPSSVLHNSFEWDDTKAAHQHRLSQARRLIASVVISSPVSNQPVRAYVNVTSEAQGQRYVTLKDALTNTDTREQVLKRALDEMERVQRSYGHLTELDAVFNEVGRLKAARPTVDQKRT